MSLVPYIPGAASLASSGIKALAKRYLKRKVIEAARKGATHIAKKAQKRIAEANSMPTPPKQNRGRSRVKSDASMRTAKASSKSRSASRMRSSSKLGRSGGGGGAALVENVIERVIPKPSGKGKKIKQQKGGCVLMREAGSLCSDMNCVYIVHGAPINDHVTTFWCALFNLVMSKHGRPINSYEDTCDQVGTTAGSLYVLVIDTIIKTTPASTTSFYFTINGTVSWLANAAQINTDYKAYATGETTWTWIRLCESLTNPLGANYDVKFCINANRLNVSYSSKAKLILKNETVGGSTTRTSYDGNDIEATPLVGYLYSNESDRHESNTFLELDRPRGAGNPYGTGVIKFTPMVDTGFTYHVATTQLNSRFYKPPEPSCWSGKVKVSKVTIEPGHIVVSNLSFKKKYKLDQCLRGPLGPIFEEGTEWATNAPKSLDFGHVRMFALEKMMYNRAANQNPVKVSWEHNTYVACKISYKPDFKTMPIQVVT